MANFKRTDMDTDYDAFNSPYLQKMNECFKIIDKFEFDIINGK